MTIFLKKDNDFTIKCGEFYCNAMVFWSCPVWKDICNFKNKIDDVFTEVLVIVWDQKHILIVLIALVRIKCQMN